MTIPQAVPSHVPQPAPLDPAAREAELEAELRQARKMEVVGRLVGGVAHDFNNQLTVISGYCGLLLKDMPKDAAKRRPLECIRDAAARSAVLTHRLLAFSRRQGLRPEIVNLNTIIKDMANPLSRMIGEDVRLVTTLAPDLGDVRTDQALFEHAVMNLAINARDAMPAGGVLTLETRGLELSADDLRDCPEAAAGPYVRLTVSDNGTGMDAETMRRVFEPFFTTKPQGQGTGLGLTMVREFVALAGGHILFHSRPGGGTSFMLHFPRVAGKADTARRPAEVRPCPRGTERILVAEDDEQVRRLIVRVLGDCGYAVLPGRGAEETLAFARQYHGRIDLLITDVIMADGCGVELAARVRALRPEIEFIYTSGYADETLRQHGVLAGDVALLRKPFSTSALAERVREVLDGRRVKERRKTDR